MNSHDSKEFQGSEEDLYQIAAIGWQNCLDHITDFQNLSVSYTPAFIAAQVAAIAAAKALPNVDVRRSTLTSKRAVLEEAGATCTANWQKLLVYIQRSFIISQHDSMRKMAGGDYYHSAAHSNWKSLDSMLTMASDFISKYIDELTNGNMPAAFETTFNTNKTAFETALKDYNDKKSSIQKETDTKTVANNALYRDLIVMLKDAKVIYHKNANIKKMFTYTALSKLVGKKGKCGFRVTVKEADTMLPITTTTLLFQPGNITAFVNAAGVAEVHLPKGIYSYTATTPGYATIEGFNLQATAGVMHRVQILVNKLVAVA